MKRIAAALAAVSASQLRSRYDTNVMNEAGIYPPMVWDQEGSADWLLDEFEKMRDFVRCAAERGFGMIRYLS